MTSLVLEVVIWSSQGERSGERTKYPGRQSEMVGLKNKNTKNLGLSAFHPIYVCRTGRKMGWQVELDCETLLISCAFPTPPLPSSSFPSGILAE